MYNNYNSHYYITGNTHVNTSNGKCIYSGIPVFVIYLKIYSRLDNTKILLLYHKCCNSHEKAGGGRKE